MRFLIDMPLSPGLASWLVEQGHDAVHASSIGLFNAPDVQIIDRALGEHRTIITMDLDYPRLLALSDATSPSIILFRGGNWSETDARERLQVVLPQISLYSHSPSIFVVDRESLRRRPLPIERT